MKMNNVFLAMMITVACLGGIAFAQSTSEPVLQVTSFSTVPATVYPGTLGYLQITLANAGTATANTVTAYYMLDGSRRSMASNQITAGSNSLLSIPFRIPQEAAGSIQVINVDIYYTYTNSAGNTPSKQTSLSIPLVVLQQNPLDVNTVSSDKSSIAPGEKLSLALELRNTGGVVNNVVITMPANSTFTIDGATQETLGSIAPNETVRMNLSIASSSSTPVGTYSIPVVFTYQDALHAPFEETLYVGPVNVLDASAQYRLSLDPTGPVEIGSQAHFKLTLKNTGSGPISAVVGLNSTNVFTPIGMQQVYFDAVPAGQSAEIDVVLGVASGTSAGYYTMPLKLSTNTGQTAVFNAGVSVDATPEVTVTLDSSSGSPQVQIANTGNSQIRSVYATAGTQGSSAMTESFIGTLNVDDFASLTLPTGTFGPVNVDITFRDSNNFEHDVKTTLQSNGQNGTSFRTGSGAQGANGARAGGANSTFQRGGGNPLGFIFGGRGAGAQSSGIDPVYLAAGGAVIIVAGYFAYKRFWKGRKKAAASMPLSASQPPMHAQEEKGRKQK